MKSALIFLAIASSLIYATTGFAAMKTENIEYKDGTTTLEGYVAYDTAIKTPHPAVLIVHQWKGLGEYEKSRARQLADLGYIAFAIDVYGKGVRPKSPEEAGKTATMYKDNRKLFREREQAAYDFLLKYPMVDKNKVVIMGYCFGGTGALELGRSGANLAGIVSFHGGLSNPTPPDAKKIKGKSLILHGAVDPNVKPEEVAAFQKEMNEAKVDYQFISYSNAVHAFTDKSAGNDPSKGVAYNEAADRRSWAAFMDFLAEVAPVR
jgi:dienelactone hydrolase